MIARQNKSQSLDQQHSPCHGNQTSNQIDRHIMRDHVLRPCVWLDIILWQLCSAQHDCALWNHEGLGISTAHILVELYLPSWVLWLDLYAGSDIAHCGVCADHSGDACLPAFPHEAIHQEGPQRDSQARVLPKTSDILSGSLGVFSDNTLLLLWIFCIDSRFWWAWMLDQIFVRAWGFCTFPTSYTSYLSHTPSEIICSIMVKHSYLENHTVCLLWCMCFWAFNQDISGAWFAQGRLRLACELLARNHIFAIAYIIPSCAYHCC